MSQTTSTPPTLAVNARYNSWTTIWNWTMARSYIRWPAILLMGLGWNLIAMQSIEPVWRIWNKGHNQHEIYDRLAAKLGTVKPPQYPSY